jgi:hypothetical protein
MNVQLVAAGLLAVFAASIHGGAGELLVVRRLSAETLAASPFGGPRMTKAMIHVTWHLTTIAFLAAGIALLLSGSLLDGDAARAVGLVAAGTSTGFAAVALGLGLADTRTPRSLLRHPGPVALGIVAALAWWGALTLSQ